MHRNIDFVLKSSSVDIKRIKIKELCVLFCYIQWYNIFASGWNKKYSKRFPYTFQCVANFYNILFKNSDYNFKMREQYVRYYLNMLVKHGVLKYVSTGVKNSTGKTCGWYIFTENKRKSINILFKEEFLSYNNLYNLLYKVNIFDTEKWERKEKNKEQNIIDFNNQFKKLKIATTLNRNIYFTYFLLNERPDDLSKREIRDINDREYRIAKKEFDREYDLK